MRSIKFRAYVKFLNEFQNVVELYNDGGCMVDDYPYALAHDDICLTQFTGLTDTNGVDIYEGDIVTYRGSHALYTSAVEWNPMDKMAGFQVKHPCIDLFDSQFIYVIGNIHQNPELLEEQ